jgi:DNA mismatch repair protein MutS
MRFESILFERSEDRREIRDAPDYFHDLHLDQIVQSITGAWSEYDLVPFFYCPLTNLDAISYRQEVMFDLEHPALDEAVRIFSRHMREMRLSINRSQKSYYKREKERLFLNGVHIYCDAVETLRSDLCRLDVKSRGLAAFQDFLADYVKTEGFTRIATEVKKLIRDLDAIQYTLLINYGSISVRPYNGEIDYTEAVERTFEKFRRGAVKEYLSRTVVHENVNHIQAQVLEGVARLNSEIFHAVEMFCAIHLDFLDPTVVRFDREIQFYVAYLTYIARFRDAGLRFCYPRLFDRRTDVHAHNTFDLALANKRNKEKAETITNDFFLTGPERIFIVSGPNQGGKTTFARTFGQMHYLAALGCQVPGSEAQLFLFDHIFTHFEREEDITNLRGKLHDDLVRIRQITDGVTSRSIVILNELFSSTTFQDALYLSQKILEILSQLDLLALWVTFLTDLASFNEKTVSMVSQINRHDPAIRTYKLHRQRAEDMAYALAVAAKHDVTYERIKERIKA